MGIQDGASLPKVSALMGAYNYGHYIVEAIESAMRQDYPAELLELVIVDDGSTDNTAELVAGCSERYPGRIKFVQQQNAGATAATNRARREATGDLIALLDADDVWLPEKTRRQVELMLARPELGMTFTRMQLINAEGAPFHSGYGHREPMTGNQFARVLWENVAVQSSLIIDADLFEEIPAQAPYADWWLCLRAAQFKQVDYLTDDLVLYRWHGANITGGVGGVKALREAQKGIEFQRWVLRNFAFEELASRLEPAEMSYVWTGLENQAEKGLRGLGSHFGVLAVVTGQDRADAEADRLAAAAAHQRGELDAASLLLLRACACDPFDLELRAGFQAMTAAATEAAKLPDPMHGVSGFAVLADLSFLLEDDRRLRDYADTMRSVPAATLVIDASREPEAAAAERLQELVTRCGLADDEQLAILGLVGELQPAQRARVRRGIHAVYAAAPAPADGIPIFTPETLAQLRELAAG
jgi:glycosyltransferase involved in cell wall biosynthesis